MKVGRLLVIVWALPVAAAVAYAQGRGGQNWNTASADAQRTAWIRSETRISAAAVQRTGPKAFQLLWKVTPESTGSRRATALTQPLILANLISHKGFKALTFFAQGDTVFAYDYDLAKVYWSTALATGTPRSGRAECTAGLASLTRNTLLTQSAIPGATPPARGPAPGPPPPPAGRGGPPPPINPNNLPIANAVWAISSGGMVHALNPHVGGDLQPPAKFVPAGAKVTGSVLVNGVLYATTSEMCGGAPNGVWAADFTNQTPGARAWEAKAVRSWDAKGARITGSAGPTLGLNNVLYVATGTAPAGEPTHANAVVALDPSTLALKDSFNAATPFTTSPLAFSFRGRDLVAAANQDGRVYVLDAESLGGGDRRSPLARSPVYFVGSPDGAPGTLASWEDPDGTRWILAAAHGSLPAATQFATSNGAVTDGAVVAFRLVEQGGALTLQPAWTSRNMASPLPPIVLNDVVFAVARGPRSMTSVLYALDARTGKEIWDSGGAIASGLPRLGISGQDGQVYVPSADGTLYAFGIPLER